MKNKLKVSWKKSVQTRHMVGLFILILLTGGSGFYIQEKSTEFAISTAYKEMETKTQYFMDIFETELRHIYKIQTEFFGDTKLIFIETPKTNISEYERRGYLLSVQEHLWEITGISTLTNGAILALPESNYWITNGTISNITEQREEMLRTYVNYGPGVLHYNEGQYFMVVKSYMKAQDRDLPMHSLVMFFSHDKIQKELEVLLGTESSGAFLFNLEEGFCISAYDKEEMAQAVQGNLTVDKQGNYKAIQRVDINGEKYLVCVTAKGIMGNLVQYIKEETILSPIRNFQSQIFIVMSLMIVFSIFLISYLKKIIHKPIQVLMEGFERMEAGDFNYHIDEEEKNEFGVLYEGFNETQNRILKLINEVYVQKNLADHAQMKQLQAQINPHFLYNSFFILSRRIKKGDYKNAMELADYLGEYFRFLNRNGSDYIPLRDEVKHAISYAKIQESRFSGRIKIEFEELPERIEGILMPRLTLQPLIENVFEHGLYNKLENGLLRVSFVVTEKGAVVSVEDNGEECTDEVIHNLQQKLSSENDGEITGIMNIHKRLIYYYRGEGRLVIERSDLGGLKISVVLVNMLV